MPLKSTGQELAEFRTLGLAALSAFVVQAAREWTRDNPEHRGFWPRVSRTFSLATLASAFASVVGAWTLEVLTVSPLMLYSLGGLVGMLGVNAYQSLTRSLLTRALTLAAHDLDDHDRAAHNLAPAPVVVQVQAPALAAPVEVLPLEEPSA